MCTLAFAYKTHPEYPLIFIGNRDEFYERDTQEAHFWNGVLSGIDVEKGGTWTGVSQTGRLAFLTNYRDFSLHVENPESRGFLTKDFLTGDATPETYLAKVAKRKNMYNPFNLIVGNLDALYYYSNVNDVIAPLRPGIYGLSNALLDSEWPKVKQIKRELTNAISGDSIDTNLLFSILEDRKQAPDDALPKTGISLDLEKSLSSLFIELDQYGTRHETIILVHRTGRVTFIEKMRTGTGNWVQNPFEFNIIGG